MSLPIPSEVPDLVSKVSFFPVSDSTGENKALIVTIKKVVPEGEEIHRIMETTRRNSSSEPKRKSRSSRASVDKSNNKSTMTDASVGVSSETQTSVELKVPLPPSAQTVELPVPAVASAQTASNSGPCLKHAAENISQKASTTSADKLSLCNNCSKSMLSYIFVVQDFLDSLAKEISGDTDSTNCVQCLREENRLSITPPRGEGASCKSERKSSKSRESSKHVVESVSTKKSTRAKESPHNIRRYEESSDQLLQRSILQHQLDQQKGIIGDTLHQDQQNMSIGDTSHIHRVKDEIIDSKLQSTSQTYDQQSYPGPEHQNDGQNTYSGPHAHGQSSSNQYQRPASYHELPHPHQGTPQPLQYDRGATFIRPLERQQPSLTETIFHQEHKGPESSDQSSFYSTESVSSPLSEGVDGIVSTLSNAEREVYDGARNGAGWDSLSEPQERLISSSSNQIPSEAFVTMCRNNAEALGCLVLGTSLLLSRTTRTLCVVVADGVSNAFRGPLSSVFEVVQTVRSMNTLGTTKLALLEQPELGVSFEKLNVWRLLQFNKCVFINPDAVVLQNCDELFCHSELSAVPDIGWPDCFNSGVFVFVPSIRTFWNLLEFAEKQGSYDGGDQGLLNSYFNSWSGDINKKLSFVYNLMANVSYTYTPAFKQFGRNVKIVQFHGTYKPWHVKFFSHTGQISPASTVHPTYVQFVHIWLNIFRISGLRQLSQEIQSYALSQEVICAVELLRFFPLPSESEAEFFLTPPSVRLRLAERKLQKTHEKTAEIQRRKSAEFPRRVIEKESADSPIQDLHPDARSDNSISEVAVDASDKSTLPSGTDTAVGIVESAEVVATEVDAGAVAATAVPDENLLPGAEVGNYQGMKAWEQGRMDYQGSDSSENIIKRLQYLMAQPK